MNNLDKLVVINQWKMRTTSLAFHIWFPFSHCVVKPKISFIIFHVDNHLYFTKTVSFLCILLILHFPSLHVVIFSFIVFKVFDSVTFPFLSRNKYIHACIIITLCTNIFFFFIMSNLSSFSFLFSLNFKTINIPHNFLTK